MLLLVARRMAGFHAGDGISVRIEQMSKSVFRLNAGSLFLAIQRLERDGLIQNGTQPRTTGERSTTL